MTLPLAIHTARQGYSWLNASQDNVYLLERFRKAIGRMPDIDYGTPLSCGVLNDGNWVVVYRFMVEKKGDFLGRDCLYLALTWFQRSVAGSVHIARLMEMPVFGATMREPPTCFEYDAGESALCRYDPAVMTDEEQAGIGFTQAGSAFQNPFAGALRIMQEVGSKIVVTYSEAAPIAPNKKQVIAEKIPVRAIEVERPAEQAPPKKRVSYAGWTAAATALLIGAWLLDRGAAKQRQDENAQWSSGAEIAEQHVVDPSARPDTTLSNVVSDVQAARYLCFVPTETNTQLNRWQNNKTFRIMQPQFFFGSYNNATSLAVEGAPEG